LPCLAYIASSGAKSTTPPPAISDDLPTDPKGMNDCCPLKSCRRVDVLSKVRSGSKYLIRHAVRTYASSLFHGWFISYHQFHEP
jgi:hypothetical protein